MKGKIVLLVSWILISIPILLTIICYYLNISFDIEAHRYIGKDAAIVLYMILLPASIALVPVMMFFTTWAMTRSEKNKKKEVEQSE